MAERLALLALAAALPLSWLLDRLVGEPRARWHPVVWMGRWLTLAGTRVAPLARGPRAGHRGQPLLLGALAWGLGAIVVAGLAWLLQHGLLFLATQGGLAWGLAVLLMACLLKPLWAWQLLRQEVLAVEAALPPGGATEGAALAAARQQAARLVSRDLQDAHAPALREAAIETLAENLNDSVLAPWFWFLVAGLPGAALYRWANTADAMWGYRGARPLARGEPARVWTWAGRCAARADDLLSWLPARLTALCLLLGAPVAAWRGLRHEAARTPSPNSGWPMAAMARLLGLRLSKPGVYVLHAGGGTPGAGDIAAAVAHARRAMAIALGLMVVLLLARAWVGA